MVCRPRHESLSDPGIDEDLVAIRRTYIPVPNELTETYVNTGNTASSSGAMSIDTFAKWAGIGRTNAFAQIRCGSLKAIRVGRRTLVTMSAAQEWLSSRPFVEPRRSGAR